MINALKDANLKKNIILHYQPIVKYNNNSFEIYKYEALARFSNNGVVHLPNSFIEISKSCNLYHKITKLIFCKALGALKENPLLYLSINICYSDIEDDNTRFFVLKKLANTKNEICIRLTFEILETKKIKDLDMIVEFIKTVRALGAKIAIDDFGTEYANYDNLLNIDFDYVKIAGELIKDVAKSKKHFNVVKSLMGLCGELETKVIAEYVENEKIVKTLCDLNCKFMQGYHFGRPAPVPAKNLSWEKNREIIHN